ncbi:MAG: molybdopterin-dependent oxidoreductase [Thermoleophilia bacterium]
MPPTRPLTYGRRAFLSAVAAGLTGLVWAEPALRAVGSLLPGGAEAIVPTTGWRIYTVSGIPAVDPAVWRLRVGGLVERPLELSLHDLDDLPQVEQVSDFHCVTGWTVRGVRWTGVRVAELLARAGATDGARALVVRSLERPYRDTLTIEQALLPDVLLATGMDGRGLRAPHGAPARLVVPAMYGYKSVKWVDQMELVVVPERGFWEGLGYDADAWVGGSNGRA